MTPPPSTNPSTDWSEIIELDEHDRHAAFAEVIVDIQAGVDRVHGCGRAFHRRQVSGVDAELQVLADRPDWTRHGLFTEPETFQALVRLSNGGIVPQRDVVPDIRGFAISVRGLNAPGALAETTDRQDFLLINRPTFGFRDSREFAVVVPAAAAGQKQLLTALIAEHGRIGGTREAARLAKDLLRNFSGFATEDFYSAAPISCGPYAVKVRLHPHQTDKRLAARLDLAGDISERLEQGPLVFDLQLQPFVSEELTPIEDGKALWRETDSPFVTVARLTIPSQQIDSKQGRLLADRIEVEKFDPWAAMEDHRPLGEIMRARKAAYYPSQRQRHASAD